jgi:hypothetical protein
VGSVVGTVGSAEETHECRSSTSRRRIPRRTRRRPDAEAAPGDEHGGDRTATEEDAMSEPDSTPGTAEEPEGSAASGGNDVRHAGGGRTTGETTVDEALGSGPAEPE